MNYRTLQQKLKEYRAQGLTEIRINSPKEQLEQELARIEGQSGVIHTEWSEDVQKGDVVRLPFMPVVTITHRIEKADGIHFYTDLSGHDAFYILPYAEQPEMVEELTQAVQSQVSQASVSHELETAIRQFPEISHGRFDYLPGNEVSVSLSRWDSVNNCPRSLGKVCGGKYGWFINQKWNVAFPTAFDAVNAVNALWKAEERHTNSLSEHLLNK